MRGEAELNALLLLGKNYQRLRDIGVRCDDNAIHVSRIPEPFMLIFRNKIVELIDGETNKALEQYKAAAKEYAAATAE